MLNKKGAVEGDKLVNYLVSAVVLILLILGIYLVYTKLIAVPGNVPGELQAVVSGCSAAAQLGDNGKASFCDEFRNLKLSDGIARRVNCEYPLVYDDIPAEQRPTYTCGAGAETQECTRLKNGLQGAPAKETVYVDGKTDIPCLVKGQTYPQSA